MFQAIPMQSTVAPSTQAEGQSRYAWLAGMLRARITEGDWVPGAAIPAETTLAKEHGVALGTMRQAIALLVTQGLLERQHGRGTFVRTGIGGATMLRFFRFRAGKDLSATPTSEILRSRLVKATATVAIALGLKAGDEVLELLRLRSLQGEPCLLETIHLPLPLFSPLVDADTTQWGDLLYPLFQRNCGVTVNRAEDVLRFSQLTKDQSRRLGLPANHPCVQVQRRAFDLSGRCVERRITLGDAHAFQYTLNIH